MILLRKVLEQFCLVQKEDIYAPKGKENEVESVKFSINKIGTLFSHTAAHPERWKLIRTGNSTS